MSNKQSHNGLKDLQCNIFENVWKTSPDNQFIIDVSDNGDFIIVAINPAHEQCFKIDNQQLAGKPVQQVVPEPYLGEVLARYQECVDKKCPISYLEKGSFDEDGKPLDFKTQLIPVLNADNQVIQLFGIAHNISWLVQAENKLREAKSDLETTVEERTRELALANRELHELSIRDDLTKTYNRRYFFELATREYKLAVRQQSSLSVMMIDADHFKDINDKHGHAFGDKALIMLTDICSEILRDSDILGRYGGEEFAIVLPGADLDASREIAERIRSAIENANICIDGISIHLSVSIGVTSLAKKTLDFNQLLHTADIALLSAKRGGRNLVIAN